MPPSHADRRRVTGRGRAGLILTALIGAGAFVASAAELWYQAYESGRRALEQKNWAVAEQKLTFALREGPKPGRKVRTYGVNFITYLPDYYLGVVYARSGREREALEQLRKVSQISRGDPEYEEYARLVKSIEESLSSARLAAAATPPPVPTATPPTTMPPAPAATPAPSPLPTAAATTHPTPIAPPTAAAAPPSTTAPPRPAELALEAQRPRQKPEQVVALEKTALRAFYSGNYDQALILFRRLIAENGESARARFHLACSAAALSLMKGPGGKDLLAAARADYARAKTLGGSLAPDRRFISPRVLNALEAGREGS